MPPALKIGLGLYATAILGVLSIHLGLPGPGAQGIEAELQARVQARLDAGGEGWALVEMRGQKAVLRGTAPDGRAVDRAAFLAVTAAGPGGPLMGGITTADTTRVEIASSGRS
jgi:hypothetical protein